MTDLNNTELILTLTSVTPREGREPIETRDQILMSSQAKHLFNWLIQHGDVDDARMSDLQKAVFDDVWSLVERATQVIKTDRSAAEWNAAGRPDMGSR